MKKYFFILLTICSYSFAAETQTDTGRCGHILAEGDKYLQRVPLCDVSAEKHANIAMVYYKRYELCEKQGGYNFKINKLEDEHFKCGNYKNKAK